MPRLVFKPDSSFFAKIAAGAVGAQAVCADLARHGHRMVELERGSTTTKLWKDVKRKRVRIPDLVCVRCGLRVESRAKRTPQLSLSHSQADAERAWDFGMVDGDLIAFVICVPTEEREWQIGRLSSWSYWHERNWMRWDVKGCIGYFTVRDFRLTSHAKSRTKGVEEASESFLTWDGIFSTRAGTVESVTGRNVKVCRASDNHPHTWKMPESLTIFVSPGDTVRENQLLAGSVAPVTSAGLTCRGTLSPQHLARSLASKERTQRFTGVKLARLLGDRSNIDTIRALGADAEEDVYVRLEAASYLASVAGENADRLFGPFLGATDDQNRLEAVIALGENRTADTTRLLCDILHSRDNPYFMRAAAAWSLSQVGGDEAARRLVQAFTDLDQSLREEALEALVAIGGPAIPTLIQGLADAADIGAGCAEALRRQQQALDRQTLESITAHLRDNPTNWAVWLVGMLPRERLAAAVAPLERENPHLHYAISVLWGFVESWIVRNWDFTPGAAPV